MATFIALNEDAIIPTKAHRGDVGWDLYATNHYTLHAGETLKIDLGVSVEAPCGCYMQIQSRSSLAMSGIVSVGGVIDHSYTGSVGVILHNQSQVDFEIERGDRIAQGVFLYVFLGGRYDLCEGEETTRGESGYGSTGR